MSETIAITGNIVAAPEQRRLPNGVPVTSFRVASTHRWFDTSAKEWVDLYTNYYDVQAFRALGEHAFASLARGQRVFVKGRLRLREWESGEKRGKSLEIEADTVGHDLLWGTSVFTKADTGGRSTNAPTPGDESWPSGPADASGWAVPGGSPGTTDAAPSDDARGEGVESHGEALVGADTPF